MSERTESPREAGLTLGIESSCDETAAAIVTPSGEVLSSVIHSQVELHAPHGGIVPELASRDHARNIIDVVDTALVQAKVTLGDIELVSVTNRPGLVGGLLVGLETAKAIAWASNKPLVGVDHLVGHLLSVFVRFAKDDTAPRPAFPFLGLVASGGHTAIYRVEGWLAEDCHELGGTRDDAAGEAFDKTAKLLGLGYPGGPMIDRLAKSGNADSVELAMPMRRSAGLDMSFSGLKTQVARLVATDSELRADPKRNDVCASFQRAVTRTLVSRLVRAAEQEKIGRLAVVGGVAANSELRGRLTRACETRGLSAFVADIRACTDNAAMIALAGRKRFEAGQVDSFDLAAHSRSIVPKRTRKGRGAR